VLVCLTPLPGILSIVSIIQAIILGVVQGLTEFIPVSSSGHLLLTERILGVSNGGLTFDVALHIGTLLSLMVFFHEDIRLLARGLANKNEYSQLSRLIILATIPAVIAGILLENTVESTFRSVRLVAINLMIVAVLMLLAEKVAKQKNKKTSLRNTTTKQALAIGAAQAIALVPGVSRSGITITTGLFAGLDRIAATRFAFLLALPITLGAIIKVCITSGSVQISQEADLFAVGILTSFISGLFAIKFLLGFLSKHSLAVFAYYRLALGAIILLALVVIN